MTIIVRLNRNLDSKSCSLYNRVDTTFVSALLVEQIRKYVFCTNSPKFFLYERQNNFKVALKLGVNDSDRARAYMTNVHCTKANCKYHMEEITGTALHIYRN